MFSPLMILKITALLGLIITALLKTKVVNNINIMNESFVSLNTTSLFGLKDIRVFSFDDP